MGDRDVELDFLGEILIWVLDCIHIPLVLFYFYKVGQLGKPDAIITGNII